MKILRTLWQSLSVRVAVNQNLLTFDIVAVLCPNLSQMANFFTQNNTETTLDDKGQSPKFWNNFPPSTRDSRSNIYLEVVHWKLKFIRFNERRSSNVFAESLHEALRPLANNTSHNKCTMTAATVLPHLTLARTKKGTDFVNKTDIRRLQL